MRQIPLAAVRASLGWTQAEFARQIGVSRGLVNEWEAGKKPVKKAYLKAICYVTGFSEDDIILPQESK